MASCKWEHGSGFSASAILGVATSGALRVVEDELWGVHLALGVADGEVLQVAGQDVNWETPNEGSPREGCDKISDSLVGLVGLPVASQPPSLDPFQI